MRALPVGPVTPLLGSLGLHGCALLALLLAVRRPLELDKAPILRADAWAGSAVEVDAMATPDGVPTIPNAESPLAAMPAAAAVAPSDVTKSLDAAPAANGRSPIAAGTEKTRSATASPHGCRARREPCAGLRRVERCRRQRQAGHAGRDRCVRRGRAATRCPPPAKRVHARDPTGYWRRSALANTPGGQATAIHDRRASRRRRAHPRFEDLG